MKLPPFSSWAALAWAPLALSFLGHGAAQESPRALRRVEPARGVRDEAVDLKRLFSKEFQRAEWLVRLADTDLDARERSFDLLLKRARLDPLARVFLEELARDPQGGEPGWTARLALRQLGRASFPLHFVLSGADPFGPGRRTQQLLEELFAQGGQGFAPRVSTPNVPALSESAGRSVHIEQSERGARIQISASRAGQEAARAYEGESLQAILRQHPELEADLAGLRLRPEPGFGLDPGRAPESRSRPIITDRLGVIVRPLDPARAVEQGLERGLMVERTYPETYAQLLGVGAGSILLELDGAPLREVADIERALRTRTADGPLRLIWLDELGQRQDKTWRP
ncbi:MAG: hypothetical protein HOP15_18075 [Planctomycetes bacterium]|nr:hypothetical protein [Planctomycetota bacterium]